MFLNKERPLALLLQLGGIGLIAFDLIDVGPEVSGGMALVGFAVFVIGALLSKMRM
jgi:hypothetical protein